MLARIVLGLIASTEYSLTFVRRDLKLSIGKPHLTTLWMRVNVFIVIQVTVTTWGYRISLRRHEIPPAGLTEGKALWLM